jgi:hypothetical protein
MISQIFITNKSEHRNKLKIQLQILQKGTKSMFYLV